MPARAHRVRIVIEYSFDGVFVATSPDMKGLLVFSSTLDDLGFRIMRACEEINAGIPAVEPVVTTDEIEGNFSEVLDRIKQTNKRK